MSVNGIRIYMAKTINKLEYTLLYEFTDKLWMEHVKLVSQDIIHNPLVKFQTLHTFGKESNGSCFTIWLDNPYFSIDKINNLYEDIPYLSD
jgi:hypothetical protein